MRVLCAYTWLRPRTKAALERHWPATEFVDVSGSDRAYWWAICERWGKGEDLVIVEHDIEIHDEVMPSFAACDQPWCTFAYKLWEPGAWCYNALGCTRISAALQDEVSPGLITQVQAKWLQPAQNQAGNIEYVPQVIPVSQGCRCGGRGVPPCWQHVDMKIADTFEGRNPAADREPIWAHVHAPPVLHLPVDDPGDPSAGRFPSTPDRSAPFPQDEPRRSFHSGSLDERPDWWPLRPAGVALAESE